MFGFFKPKPVEFFSQTEKDSIALAIQKAEQRTSGEVRIYVESRCKYVNPVMRAKELFQALNMFETAERNGVLVYVAMKDKQLAIYGDEGIHQKVGADFWNAEVSKMLQLFNKHDYALGIATIIEEIGEALTLHFPYDAAGDKNELSNEIVFGK